MTIEFVGPRTTDLYGPDQDFLGPDQDFLGHAHDFLGESPDFGWALVRVYKGRIFSFRDCPLLNIFKTAVTYSVM